MRTFAVFSAMLIFSAATRDVLAQRSSVRVSIEASAVYALLEDFNLDFIEAGPGFEVQGRASRGPWSLGIGYQRTAHDDVDLPDDLIMTSVFAEPRFTFPTERRLQPFFSLRAARVRQDLRIDFQGAAPADAETSGTMWGGGFGMRYDVVGRTSVHIAGTYSHAAFREYRVNGVEQPDSASEATSVILRAGVQVTFGGS